MVRQFEHALSYWRAEVGDWSFALPRRGEAAVKATFTTARDLPCARAEIDLTNFAHRLSGAIAAGDQVRWWWGYLDAPAYEVEIFSGYVVAVTEAKRMVIEARDRMVDVYQARRAQSFYKETADAILAWFLSQAGVEAALHKPGLTLPHFIAPTWHAGDVAGALNHEIARRTGADVSDWPHFIDSEGVFRWGPYSTTKQPDAAKPEFWTRLNVVSQLPAVGGRSRMVTFAVPECRHSMDIWVDGEKRRCEAVTYKQRANRLRMEVTYS